MGGIVVTVAPVLGLPLRQRASAAIFTRSHPMFRHGSNFDPHRFARLLLPWVALICTVIRLAPEWVEPYSFGVDESYQVRAGVRLAHGKGLTSEYGDDFSDLAVAPSNRLHFWPPLYSWMVAAILKLGVPVASLPAGLKVFKATAVFLGLLGWGRIGIRLLSGWWPLVWFATVGTVFFPDRLLLGPSTFYLWSASAWYFAFIVDALETGAMLPVLFAGLSAAVAVGFRYAGSVIVPSGALALLWATGGTWSRRWSRALLAGLPATLTVIAFQIDNRLHAAAGSWVDELPPEWNWRRLLCGEPLEFLFACGWDFREMLIRLRPSWETVSFAWFTPWLVVIAVCGALAWRTTRSRLTPVQRGFLASAFLSALCLIALLGAIAFRAEPKAGWNPLGDERMYQDIVPAVGLAWIIILAGLVPLPQSASAKAVIAVFAAVVGITVGANMFRTLRIGGERIVDTVRKGFPDSFAIDAEVRRLVANAGTAPHRVFDTYDSVCRQLRWSDTVECSEFAKRTHLAASSCSRSVYVVVVVRRKLDRYGGPPIDQWDTDVALAYADFFALSKVSEIEDRYMTCDIHAGWVAPYSPGERAPRLKPWLAKIHAVGGQFDK